MLKYIVNMMLKYVIVVGIFLLSIGFLIHYLTEYTYFHCTDVQERENISQKNALYKPIMSQHGNSSVAGVQVDTFFGKPVGYPYYFFKEGTKVKFMDVEFHILKTRYSGPPTVKDLSHIAEVKITFPDGWSTKINVQYGGYVSVGLTRIYITKHKGVEAGVLIIEGKEIVLLVREIIEE